MYMFLSHTSEVLRLLLVHCRLSCWVKGGRCWGRECTILPLPARGNLAAIPHPPQLILRKCALVWCVSRLLSVLWPRGETALHKAACQRHRAVCQLLVDAGASLRKTDSKVTQPRQPVIKHCSQAGPISIRPCCVHDWGFLVSAKSSSF